MSDTAPETDETEENRSTVDPEEVVREYNTTDKTQVDVAEEFGITQQHVSRLVNTYEAGREEGKEEGYQKASIDSLVDDEEPDDDPYSTACPNCQERIPQPDSPGSHPCPECGSALRWSKVELGME